MLLASFKYVPGMPRGFDFGVEGFLSMVGGIIL
jgi:hypothetical protein